MTRAVPWNPELRNTLMLREAELIGMIEGLRRSELRRWLMQGWVIAERRDGILHFRAIDIARVQLIVDMRRTMQVSEENLPMVLSLVDQVYSLRRELRDLAGAVAEQPAAVRKAITGHVHKRRSGGDNSGGAAD
jgi:chaperone modulatory protein CbpM